MIKRHAELCRVTTQDGLLLDGALRTPEQPTDRFPIDACLLVHGTGGNFTTPGVLETLAQQAMDAGLTSLRINTRGHDLMARVPRANGAILGGASYENIADCRHDLTAWADFLVERGCARIALIGHSLGGVKGVYATSRNPHPNVTHLLAISPPRFNHAHFLRHKLAGQFREDYRRADALVSRGEGETVIQVRQPMPLVITASGFVAKYGPHDNYDIIKLLPHVACPTLVLIGSESARVSPAFDGLEAELSRLASQRSNLAVRVIEGADVTYSTHLAAPFECMVDWLRTET